MRLSKLLTFAFVVPAFLAGCASENRRVDNVAVDVSPTDNPEEGIRALEQELSEARSADVGVLAPTWFASAEKSLENARALRSSNGSLNDIFREVAQGRAQISRAKQISETSRTALSEVTVVRKEAYRAVTAAETAGATNTEALNEDLQKADLGYRDLAKAIEDDKLDRAERNKPEVLAAYAKLTTRSVRKQELDTAKRIVEEAKKQNASKYAPRALEYAEQMIESTAKFIEANPKAESDIAKKSGDANFYAKRALLLTQRSRQLDEQKPEERVVWFERGLTEVGQALGTDDKRDEKFETQIDALKSAALAARQNSDSSLAAKASTDEKNAQLQSSAAQGAMLKEKEAAFRKVSGQFAKDEAEVIRSGDSVVIRLRGIKFPSGEAKLGTENFALLQKVTAALKEYPDAKITVEGHTDSVGGKETNLKLSEKRAEAVAKFFTASALFPAENVSAVGRGFEEPLATNKTKAGRQANRRIDVVIGK